jgi:hypothetical protein
MPGPTAFADVGARARARQRGHDQSRFRAAERMPLPGAKAAGLATLTMAPPPRRACRSRRLRTGTALFTSPSSLVEASSVRSPTSLAGKRPRCSRARLRPQGPRRFVHEPPSIPASERRRPARPDAPGLGSLRPPQHPRGSRGSSGPRRRPAGQGAHERVEPCRRPSRPRYDLAACRLRTSKPQDAHPGGPAGLRPRPKRTPTWAGPLPGDDQPADHRCAPGKWRRRRGEAHLEHEARPHEGAVAWRSQASPFVGRGAR